MTQLDRTKGTTLGDVVLEVDARLEHLFDTGPDGRIHDARWVTDAVLAVLIRRGVLLLDAAQISSSGNPAKGGAADARTVGQEKTDETATRRAGIREMAALLLICAGLLIGWAWGPLLVAFLAGAAH